MVGFTMSTATERSKTEFMADSHKWHTICDSSTTQRTSDLVADDRKRIGPTSPIRLRHVQPNKRFHRADSTPDEDIVRFEFFNNKQSHHDQEEEEEGSLELFSRQAAEVAAAARFISKVDVIVIDTTFSEPPALPRPRLGSITYVRDSILDSSLYVQKSRPARMEAHSSSKRSKFTIPPPLQLSQSCTGSEEIQSPLPTRTSSRGAPSFDIARPLGSARPFPRSVTSPGLDSGSKIPLSILTPESANTFQFDFSMPVEPQLSRSGSDATADSDSPPTPSNSLSEDQIRREIEAFASEQGPYLRGSQRRMRRVPLLGVEENLSSSERCLPLLSESDVHNDLPSAATNITEVPDGTQVEAAISLPALRRKKSIFGWLQKNPEVEVDDLLDLYLTDEQREEVNTVKHKATRSKLNAFRNRITTDPLPMNTG